MEERDYLRALELALEGETQDSSLPGLVIRWKQLRFAAYDALNLREEQRKLARELLFAGTFEYYGELKKLASGNEDVIYHQVKEDLKKEMDEHLSVRSFARYRICLSSPVFFDGATSEPSYSKSMRHDKVST